MPQARPRPSEPPSARPPMGPSSRASQAPRSAAPREPPLPPYQSPVAPLNPDAQLKLQSLIADTHSIRKLEDQNNVAGRLITDAATSTNDLATSRGRNIEAVRKRKTRDGGEVDEEFLARERAVSEFREKVDKMTVDLDKAMRKTVDGYAGNRHLESVLNGLVGTTQKAGEEQTQYEATQAQRQTQQSQVQRSQAQRSRRVGDDEDEDAESEGDVTQIPGTGAEGQEGQGQQEPAPPAPAVPALAPAFTEGLAMAQDRYTSQSLTKRYAQQNEYSNFKKVVWDAQHPDEDQRLPHHNMWFAKEEDRQATPGVTSRQTGDGDARMGEDEDDDIAIARVNISTRCPITLREFTDPVTSKQCHHSFERAAISEMVRAQRPPTRGRHAPPSGWVASVQCPVNGCNQQISEQDLEHDPVLVRKIKRVQRAKEDEENLDRDGDDEGRDEVESVGSSDDDAEDVDHIGTMRSVKSERRATMEDIDDD